MRLVRPVLVLLGTLVAAWLVAITTIGSVFAQSQPALALAASRRNASANSYRALQVWQEEPLHPNWSVIDPLARAALARSPADVTAISMLGAEADARGREALAIRVFSASNRLSRRNQLTQMFLIEMAVKRGDIREALAHYNAGLSTTRATADVMMPVLVAASADPAIARPLAAMLAHRPIWWADFTRRMVETKADPGASFPVLLPALRLDPAKPVERGMLSAALSRLVDSGHGATAYVLYRRTRPGTPAVPATVRDGGFEHTGYLPPFDWDLRNDGGVSAYVQPQGQGNVLFVSAQGPAEVASQRLLLPPGRYALAARIGGRQGAATALSLICDGAAEPLAVLHAGTTRDAGLSGALTVPAAGCASQRLSVSIDAADQPGGQSWIDDVAVTSLH